MIEMVHLLEKFPCAAELPPYFEPYRQNYSPTFRNPSQKRKTGSGNGDGNFDDEETISKAMNKLLALSTEIEDVDPSGLGVDDKDDKDKDSESSDNEERLEGRTSKFISRTDCWVGGGSDHWRNLNEDGHNLLKTTIKNSSTIILPHWNIKLKELSLDIFTMRHEVSTRWKTLSLNECCQWCAFSKYLH